MLTSVGELLANDGVLASRTPDPKDSPRRRGIRLGFFLMLVGIVLAPVLGLIFQFGLGMVPWPMGVVLFLLGGGGLLRIVYALMFEPKHRALPEPALQRQKAGIADTTMELGNGDVSIYVSPEFGRQRRTNELEHHSVTDETTKLLKKKARDRADDQ